MNKPAKENSATGTRQPVTAASDVISFELDRPDTATRTSTDTPSTAEVAPLNNNSKPAMAASPVGDAPENNPGTTSPRSLTFYSAGAVESRTGWPARDPKDINIDLFDPVWVSEEEFPGELPEELREIVGSGEFIQMAGSLRSLFWIAGVDEAVEIIDDPTRKLEDCIEVVPVGTSVAGFLINRYVEEKLLPVFLEEKFLGFEYDTPDPPARHTVHAFAARVPESVNRTATTAELCTLYRWMRQRSWPRSVKALKIAHQKNSAKWVSDARRDHGDLLNKSGLLFRGLSLIGLEQSLSFFMPVISGANHTNEFGPSIYVTPDLEYAKHYAGLRGAIMVFRHPNTRDLEVWEPPTAEWRLLVAHHLELRHRPEVPPRFNTADVIIGPISQCRRMESEGDLQQMDTVQHSYASYRACEKLSASLIGIIYIN